MFKLYKNGDYAVNNATFDYVCDSVEDLNSIPKNKSTLGSTALVIDQAEGIRVFVCDSSDNWVEVESNSGSSGSGSGSSYVLTKDKINKVLNMDVASEVESLNEKAEEAQTKIAENANEIAQQAAEINKINTKNSEQDTKIANQETKITNIEKKNSDQDTKISNIEKKNSEQDTKLTNIEKKNSEQDTKISNIEKKNSEQDTKISNIETKNNEQDIKITNLEAKDIEHDGKLSDIEAKNAQQELRLFDIESKDAEQDNKLSDIDTKIAEHETKLDDAQNKFAEQASKNATLEAKNTEQDERIEKLEKRPVVPVNTNNYELLNEITCDGTYNVITLSQTDAEEDYNLSAVYTEFKITKPTATASIRIFANDIVTANVTNGIPSTSSNSNPFNSSAKITIEGGKLTNVSTGTYQSIASVGVQSYGSLLKGENIDAITKIDIASSTATVFPAGSVIRVYGIKE